MAEEAAQKRAQEKCIFEPPDPNTLVAMLLSIRMVVDRVHKYPMANQVCSEEAIRLIAGILDGDQT